MRLHQIECQACGRDWWQKIRTRDLPGGIRIKCSRCGQVAIHISCSLHPDEPTITRDPETGKWSGETETRYL